MTRTLPTFDYVTVTVRPLDERFHALIAKELAGTISEDETRELDTLCHVKEAQHVPLIPAKHLQQILGGYALGEVE